MCHAGIPCWNITLEYHAFIPCLWKHGSVDVQLSNFRLRIYYCLLFLGLASGLRMVHRNCLKFEKHESATHISKCVEALLITSSNLPILATAFQNPKYGRFVTTNKPANQQMLKIEIMDTVTAAVYI